MLAVIVLASFVCAQANVSDSPQHQCPDCAGAARALGAASGTRAIVANDGSLASDPLATYLPRVPWTEASDRVVTVGEVDDVGYRWQTPGQPLHVGVRWISTKTVDEFVVGAAVLVQNSPSARSRANRT